MLFNINMLMAHFLLFVFFYKGVTGGVMLLINLAVPVLHVPLVLEEVVEKTFVIEVCIIPLLQL